MGDPNGDLEVQLTIAARPESEPRLRVVRLCAIRGLAERHLVRAALERLRDAADRRRNPDARRRAAAAVPVDSRVPVRPRLGRATASIRPDACEVEHPRRVAVCRPVPLKGVPVIRARAVVRELELVVAMIEDGPRVADLAEAVVLDERPRWRGQGRDFCRRFLLDPRRIIGGERGKRRRPCSPSCEGGRRTCRTSCRRVRSGSRSRP